MVFGVGGSVLDRIPELHQIAAMGLIIPVTGSGRSILVGVGSAFSEFELVRDDGLGAGEQGWPAFHGGLGVEFWSAGNSSSGSQGPVESLGSGKYGLGGVLGAVGGGGGECSCKVGPRGRCEICVSRRQPVGVFVRCWCWNGRDGGIVGRGRRGREELVGVNRQQR